jgi:hypothetical protein
VTQGRADRAPESSQHTDSDGRDQEQNQGVFHQALSSEAIPGTTNPSEPPVEHLTSFASFLAEATNP